MPLRLRGEGRAVPCIALRFSQHLAGGVACCRHSVSGSCVNKVLGFGGFVENGIMKEKGFWEGYTNDVVFVRPCCEGMFWGHNIPEEVASRSTRKPLIFKNVTQMAIPNNNYGDIIFFLKDQAWQRLALDYKLAHYQKKNIERQQWSMVQHKPVVKIRQLYVQVVFGA